MTAVERLDQIEARAAAATEGPWEAAGDNDDYVGLYGPGSEPIFAPGEDEGLTLRVDAEFIAAARTDVPALVAGLRAVLDLHRPSKRVLFSDPYCVGCWEAGGEDGAPTWPCPTVRAITAALDPS